MCQNVSGDWTCVSGELEISILSDLGLGELVAGMSGVCIWIVWVVLEICMGMTRIRLRMYRGLENRIEGIRNLYRELFGMG